MQALIARQAVYDRRRQVVAYELLFRSAGTPDRSLRNDTAASCEVLDNGLFGIGVDQLLQGRRGLVNVSRDLLLDPRLQALPPEVLALELLETIPPDEDVLAVCRQLRGLGYTLVLDDYSGEERRAPFFEVVDWVKVDLRACPEGLRKEFVRDLARYRKRLLAEKVETEDEFNRALAAGYEMFQGYFLHKPQVLVSRKLSVSQAHAVQMMAMACQRDLDLFRLSTAIEQDVALCYKLVRYANSVRFGALNEIRSIPRCLLRLGEIEIRRWLTMSVLNEMAGKTEPALTETSLFRARMCESLTCSAGRPDMRQSAYLAGMFSLLDAILRAPMSDLVEQLGLDGPLRSTLLNQPEAPELLRAVLDTATAYEVSSWNQIEACAKRLNIPPPVLQDAYVCALQPVDYLPPLQNLNRNAN